MILHLITDDKFADYSIKQFSGIPGSSEFILVSDNKGEDITAVRNKDKVTVLAEDSPSFTRLIESLADYKAVVMHGLFYQWQEKIISHLPQNVKLVWMCWGGEIYARAKFTARFLEPKTKNLYFNKRIKKYLKGNSSKDEIYFIDLKNFKRIDYCLSDMYNEYEFVNKLTNSTMKYLWYNYYSIEETLGELIDKTINGQNIFIGNSCTLSNNHPDTFRLLKKFNLQDRKIIVPLSYGTSWLRTKIVDYGERCFGENFDPLLDFMKRDSYNEVLRSGSIMIMNHKRPQAQGNIISGLWLGAKVYLNQNSMTYDYFKSIGAIVYSMQQELKPSNPRALEPLGQKERDANREILLKVYGRENMQHKVALIVNELNK